ncbi:putative DNA-binding protein with PD1-like motif [Bradyrhizobium sp. USDA 4509]
MQNDHKKRQVLKGKIEEVIYAEILPGEDFLQAVWDICKENDIKTGLLLEATGYLMNLRIHRYPHERRPGTGFGGVDFTDITGSQGFEITATGIIGLGWVPDKSVTPGPVLTRLGGHSGFGAIGFEGHETPYANINVVGTNAAETVCGHLMEGCPSYSPAEDHPEWDPDVPTHFTIVIAKVSGPLLRATLDRKGFYHELVPT